MQLYNTIKYYYDNSQDTCTNKKVTSLLLHSYKQTFIFVFSSFATGEPVRWEPHICVTGLQTGFFAWRAQGTADISFLLAFSWGSIS